MMGGKSDRDGRATRIMMGGKSDRDGRVTRIGLFEGDLLSSIKESAVVPITE